jgi:KDO2-lipid IV(A) lauroyltransferase
MMENENLRVIQINDNPLSGVEALQALRNNEIVAMQGDRTIGDAGERLDFLGQPAEFPLGPFLLSAFSGAPVLPGVVLREGWLRYRVVMGELIEPPATARAGAGLRAALQPAVGFLETVVRSHPCQWLNFYDFWGPAQHGRNE